MNITDSQQQGYPPLRRQTARRSRVTTIITMPRLLRTCVITLMTLVVLGTYLTLGLAPVASATTGHGVDQGFSTSWSGFALDAMPGTYHQVSADLVVPGPQICTSSRLPTSSWYYWAGLDGYKSDTVEQVGVALFCSGHKSTYTAWYEAFPHGFVSAHTLRIHSGQRLRLVVSALRDHHFRLTIALISKSAPLLFNRVITVPRALTDSAECIMENPNTHTQAITSTVEFTACQVNHAPLIKGNSNPTSLTLIDPKGVVQDTLTPLNPTGGFKLMTRPPPAKR